MDRVVCRRYHRLITGTKTPSARRRPRRSFDDYLVAALGLTLLVCTALLIGSPDPKTAHYGSISRPSSPDAWAAEAERALEAGRIPEAVRSMERASQLAPHIAPVSMRAVHLYLAIEDKGGLLRSAAVVLRATQAYDASIFEYMEDLGIASPAVIQALQYDRRVLGRFLAHACATPDRGTRARDIWTWLKSNGRVTESNAVDYVGYLVRSGAVFEGAAEWAAWKRAADSAYLRSNRIFNGGFELPSAQSAFDWRIGPVPGASASVERGPSRSGSAALQIDFAGTENIAYAHAAQLVSLPAGTYALRAWMRSEGLTTDQGVYLEACGARTEAVRGTTSGWVERQATLNVAHETSCEVRIRRDLSRKIDSKIAGRVFIDDVEINAVR